MTLLTIISYYKPTHWYCSLIGTINGGVESNYTHLYDFTAATQLDYQIDKKQVQKSLVTVGMVANPDSSMHGQKSMKQEHQFFRRDETIESIKNALASKGLDSKQSFAFISFSEDGRVQVHASGQVKGFLDEQSMGSCFQEAYEKAVHDSFIVPEPSSDIAIDDDQESDYGDEDFPLIPQTMGLAKGTRVYRTTRQCADRGRLMLPCDAARHAVVDSYPEPDRIREVTPSDSEQKPVQVQPKKFAKSFRIDDEEHVSAFLKSRLKQMQQLAVKKIAKAWIKGICPRKQAKFPYNNNKKGSVRSVDFVPRVPGWWPTEGCRFVEPDHIRRDERMLLCLHLLRLRPTPAQLKEWNEDKSEPHPTHVQHGWTAFLQELAGVAIFEDLQKEDKKRTESKKELLGQMYDVAQMEEGYLNGENDPSSTFSWEEDERNEEKRTIPAKRPYQSAEYDFDLEQASRHSSESVDLRRAKRSRRNSNLDGDFHETTYPQGSNVDVMEDSPSKHPQQVVRPEFLYTTDGVRQNPASPSTGNKDSMLNNRALCQHDAKPMVRDSRRHFDQIQGRWSENVETDVFSAPANLFAMSDHYQNTTSAPSGFVTHQGYNFPQHEQPSMVQAYQVSQVPEPQFQSVSNASMYSPGIMSPMQLSNFMPQECDTAASFSQPYTNSMAPSQYFMPSNAGPSVGDFHPPMPQAYHNQHGLAERHIAPMQVHGLPFNQPSSWEGGPFNGQSQNPV